MAAGCRGWQTSSSPSYVTGQGNRRSNGDETMIDKIDNIEYTERRVQLVQLLAASRRYVTVHHSANQRIVRWHMTMTI